MKRKLYFLLSLLITMLIGWSLGYIRVPNPALDNSFWLGFLAAGVLMVFALVCRVVWYENARLVDFLRRASSPEESGAINRSHRLIWLLVAGFILLGGGSSAFLIYQQNQLAAVQHLSLETQIAAQKELMLSTRENHFALVLDNVLDNVEADLEQSKSGTLTNATIKRIAQLSASFKPYEYEHEDTAANVYLSPERGQILKALYTYEIDSVSLALIKRLGSFHHADLSGMHFSYADLSGIDLHGAMLQNTNLNFANLKSATVRYANLWDANLNYADLRGADFKESTFSWARLIDADLRSTILDGANMSNAHLIGANMGGASCVWTNLDGAMLNEANLIATDLKASSQVRANFTNADLTQSRLRRTDFTESILSGAIFTHAEIDSGWLAQLATWRTIGGEAILENYREVKADTAIFQFTKFRLEPVSEN